MTLPQRFVISHPDEATFKSGGLRGYSVYRDLGGVTALTAGSSWVQPPGIQHTVVGWSDDCELLEIILPAEHETVNDT